MTAIISDDITIYKESYLEVYEDSDLNKSRKMNQALKTSRKLIEKCTIILEK